MICRLGVRVALGEGVDDELARGLLVPELFPGS
jgi:hypothetical protein